MARTLKCTEANAAAYKNMQQDAKSFYGEAEKVHQKSALSLLHSIDPPDPEGDKGLIDHFVAETKASAGIGATFGYVRDEKIREHAEGMATLARWMQKAGGKPDTVKDFYRDNATTALFPLYIESRIQQALLGTSLVSELIMSDEVVPATQVIGLTITDAEADRSLRKIGEGTELPTTTFTKGNSVIQLYKFGRRVLASYEAIQSQSVDAFGNFLGRIGKQIGADETDRLLDIAIIGDGSGVTLAAAETNATDTDVAVAGSIAFADMLNWYMSVPNPAYRLDKAIAGRTDLRLIADLVEFTDPLYIQGQGVLRIPTPVAMSYHWWQGGVADSHYLDRMVIGIDSRVAFAAYTYGGFLSETGKIIENQMEQTTFSYWRGFRKNDTNGCQVLDVNAVL